MNEPIDSFTIDVILDANRFDRDWMHILNEQQIRQGFFRHFDHFRNWKPRERNNSHIYLMSARFK